MAKSSRRGTAPKPAKPYPGFPLTPHPSGRWCKKIRGKLHYFGRLDNPSAALERFNREWPFLKDGRTAPPIDTGDGCTIKLLCNAFLSAKKMQLESDELSPRTFAEYHRFCVILVDHFGGDRRVDDLLPEDFQGLRRKLAARFAPITLKNAINYCRVVLKFAFDQRLIEKPVHFGQSFDRPSAKTLRKARHAAGPKVFTAGEAKRIHDAAKGQLKAMTLLGLNCGFGNSDCATLPRSALNLGAGWLDYPRPKTAIHRRIPLWPETVKSLEAVIADRPAAKDPVDADLVFLTRRGMRWVRTQQSRKSDRMTNNDEISKAFSKLLKGLGIDSHRNFYALRHCFETIAGESKDQVAVDAIMGHVDPSMGAVYREGVSDERLTAAVNTVRAWLGFDKKSKSVK